MNTLSLFRNAIGRSTWTGSLAVGGGVAILIILIMPLLEITMTVTIVTTGFFLGLLVGLGNGIILGIVTRLWFFPLTNPKLHRQVLNAISIVLCTSISIVFLLEKMRGVNFIFVLVLSLSVGLSMRATSKSIARWYQQESEL